jgi:hypothetical protein
MATQETHQAYARLYVSEIGTGSLHLCTSGINEIRVILPPHLARVLRLLIEHRLKLRSDVELEVKGYIGAKDLARLRKFSVSFHDVKAYIYRIRRMISQAAEKAGIPNESCNLILSKQGWGYSINPDFTVEVKVL